MNLKKKTYVTNFNFCRLKVAPLTESLSLYLAQDFEELIHMTESPKF